jgi:hypothetical protein
MQEDLRRRGGSTGDQRIMRGASEDVYVSQACARLPDWRWMNAMVLSQGKVLSCPGMKMLD